MSDDSSMMGAFGRAANQAAQGAMIGHAIGQLEAKGTRRTSGQTNGAIRQINGKMRQIIGAIVQHSLKTKLID